MARNLLVICRQETTLTGNAMAQIPLMPQMTGGNSSTAITSESESELFSLSAEGMVIGIPFDRALQELLTPQDSEGGVQLFAMQMPVDVENQPLPMPMLTQDGKLLPLPQQADGKPLPQISEQPLLTIQATELPAPVSATLTQKVQTEVAAPKFANLVNYINTEKPVDLLPLISAESSDRASEGVIQYLHFPSMHYLNQPLLQLSVDPPLHYR
ncbi:MAG: hypothetical protein ABW100_03150 [Candidatus Thiodiazotropha sp. 6PLUC3]